MARIPFWWQNTPRSGNLLHKFNVPNCICALKFRFQIIIQFWKFQDRLKNKTSQNQNESKQSKRGKKGKKTRNCPPKQVNWKDIRVWVALVLSVSPSLQLPTCQPFHRAGSSTSSALWAAFGSPLETKTQGTKAPFSSGCPEMEWVLVSPAHANAYGFSKLFTKCKGLPWRATTACAISKESMSYPLLQPMPQ